MNFIIYEDDINYINRYKQIIHKVMSLSKSTYKIINIDHYEEEVFNKIITSNSKKIYIMDIEVPNKNGIDLARQIRKSGDWISPIIIITSYDELKKEGYTSKILMLDFISKLNNIEKELYNDLMLSLEINKTYKTLNITSKGEIYQIPYQDILYIEKNVNDNYSTIITNNNKYIVRKTINKLYEEIINDANFFKTHRSFIVNIKNIKSINFNDSIIDFGKNRQALISRSNKKELKERINNINDYSYK